MKDDGKLPGPYFWVAFGAVIALFAVTDTSLAFAVLIFFPAWLFLYASKRSKSGLISIVKYSAGIAAWVVAGWALVELGHLWVVPVPATAPTTPTARLDRSRSGKTTLTTSPDGRRVAVPDENLELAKSKGYKVITEASKYPLEAGVQGALRGLTSGLSDIAMSDFDKKNALALQEQNPNASKGGDLVGSMALLAMLLALLRSFAGDAGRSTTERSGGGKRAPPRHYETPRATNAGPKQRSGASVTPPEPAPVVPPKGASARAARPPAAQAE